MVMAVLLTVLAVTEFCPWPRETVDSAMACTLILSLPAPEAREEVFSVPVMVRILSLSSSRTIELHPSEVMERFSASSSVIATWLNPAPAVTPSALLMAVSGI